MNFLRFGACGSSFETHVRPRRISLVQQRSLFIVMSNENHGDSIRTDGCSLSRYLCDIGETFCESVDWHVISVLVFEFRCFHPCFLNLCACVSYIPTTALVSNAKGFGKGGSTNHAGCDTADSTVDFVDCCDAVGVEEFVWDFLLTDDDGCRFGFDADYSDSS